MNTSDDVMVDENVVSLQFDNKKFEKNTKQSIKTLNDFKRNLNFDKETKQLNSFNKELNKNTNSNLDKSLELITRRMSSLGVVGASVLNNITTDMINFGKQSLVTLRRLSQIDQIKSGGFSRALNIEQARFQLEGLKKDVDAYMESVSKSVDGTAYGLDAAASVASQLAASGIEAGEGMTSILKGVAGVAAMTSSSFEDIGKIYTTVAGNGRLMGDQLLQLSQRGINAAAILGQAFNKTEAEIRDMVTHGQISFEMFSSAMSNAFGEHATKANATFSGSLSNVRAALSRIGQQFADPYINRAREMFNDLIPILNNIKNSIFPIADYYGAMLEKAKNYVFILSNTLSTTKAFTNISKGLVNVFETLVSVLRPIGKAFLDVFLGNLKHINDFSKSFLAFSKTLEPSKKFLEGLGKTANDVFAVFKVIGITVIEVWRNIIYTLSSVFNYINGTNNSMHNLGDTIRQVAVHIASFIIWTANWISYLVQLMLIIDELTGFSKEMLNVGTSIINLFSTIGNGFMTIINALFPNINSFSDLIVVLITNAVKGITYIKNISLTFINFIKSADGILNSPNSPFVMFTTTLKNAGITGESVANGLTVAFKTLFDITLSGLTGVFKALVQGLKESKPVIDEFVTSLLETVNSVISIVIDNVKKSLGIIISIISVKIFYDIYKIVMGLFKGVTGIFSIFNNISKMFEAITDRIKAGIPKALMYLHAITGLIISITALTLVFALLPADKIDQAIAKFGIMLGAIAALSAVLIGFSKWANSEKNDVSGTLVRLSFSLFITCTALIAIAGSVAMLKDMDVVDVGAKLGILTASILTILILPTVIEKDLGRSLSITKISLKLVAVIAAIAFIIQQIASLLVSLKDAKFENIAATSIGLILILGTISIIVKNLSKLSETNIDVWKVSSLIGSMVSLTSMISTIGNTLKVMNDLDPIMILYSTGIIILLTYFMFRITKMISELEGSGLDAAKIAGLSTIFYSIGNLVNNIGVAISSIAKSDTVSILASGFVIDSIIGLIVLLMDLFTKMKDLQAFKFLELSGIMLVMSVALRSITKVIIDISKLSVDQLGYGMLTIVGIISVFITLSIVFTQLDKVIKGIDVGSIRKFAISMSAISLALIATVMVIKIISGIDPSTLAKGAITIGAIVGLFIGFNALLNLFKGEFKNFGKFALSMALISASLLAVILVIYLTSKIPEKEIIKGIATIGALVGLFTLISLFISLFGRSDNFKNFAIMVAGIGVSLLLCLGIIKLVNSIPLDEILKGSLFILALSSLFILIANMVSNVSYLGDMKNFAIMLGGLSIALLACSAVILIIGGIDNKSLAKGLITITILSLIFSQIPRLMSEIQNSADNLAFKSIVKVFLIVGAFVSIVSTLAIISSFDHNIASSISILITVGSFLALATIIAKTADNIKWSGVFKFMLIPIILGEMVFALSVLSLYDYKSIIAASISLGIVLATLALTIGGITALSNVITGKTLLTIGLMGLVLASVGLTLGLLLNFANNLNQVLDIAKSLSLVMISLTAIFVVLGMSSALVGPAITGCLGFIAVISILGVFFAGIGALVQQYPDILSWLAYAEQVSIGIGKAVGGIIGGIAAGVAEGAITALPAIGTALSQFMENASTFFEGINGLDFSNIGSGIKALVEAFAIMMGSKVLDGFTNLINFMTNPIGTVAGSAATAVGLTNPFDQLTLFAKSLGGALMAISESTKDISNIDQLSTIVDIAKRFTEIANLIPRETGFITGLMGEQDLADFGKKIVSYINAMISANEKIAGITFYSENFKMAADIGSVMQGLASTIPAKGAFQALMGEQDLADFGRKIVSYINSIILANNTIANKEFYSASFSDVVSIGKEMQELASSIPAKGAFQALMGEQDLADFGRKVNSFMVNAASASSYAVNINTAGLQNLSYAYQSLKSFINLLKVGGVPDATDVKDLAEKMPAIAEALSKVNGSINSVQISNGYDIGTENLTSDMVTIGSQAAAGFANGLSNNDSLAKVIVASRQLAQTSIDTAKQTLDSHSPSKKFTTIGIDVNKGFWEGLKNKKTRNKIKKQIVSNTKMSMSAAEDYIKKAEKEYADAYKSTSVAAIKRSQKSITKQAVKTTNKVTNDTVREAQANGVEQVKSFIGGLGDKGLSLLDGLIPGFKSKAEAITKGFAEGLSFDKVLEQINSQINGSFNLRFDQNNAANYFRRGADAANQKIMQSQSLNANLKLNTKQKNKSKSSGAKFTKKELKEALKNARLGLKYGQQTLKEANKLNPFSLTKDTISNLTKSKNGKAITDAFSSLYKVNNKKYASQLKQYDKNLKKLKAKRDKYQKILSDPKSTKKEIKSVTSRLKKTNTELDKVQAKRNDAYFKTKGAKGVVSGFAQSLYQITDEYKESKANIKSYTNEIIKNNKAIAKNKKIVKNKKASVQKRKDAAQNIKDAKASNKQLKANVKSEKKAMTTGAKRSIESFRATINDTYRSLLNLSNIDFSKKLTSGFEKIEKSTKLTTKRFDAFALSLSDSTSSFNILDVSLNNVEDSLKQTKDAFSILNVEIDTGINLLEEYTKEGTISASRLIENAKSQLNAYEEFQNGLAKIKSMGLSSTVIDQLEEEGPSALKYIRGFMAMSASEIETYNSLVANKTSKQADKLVSETRKTKEDIAKYSEDISTLVTRGLDKDIANKLRETGVDSGYDLVKTLLSMDETQIKSLGQDMADIISEIASTSVGITATEGTTSYIQALKNNVEEYNKWRQNLKTLTDSGLDYDIIKSFEDKGIESSKNEIAAILKDINDSGSSVIKEINSYYNKYKNLTNKTFRETIIEKNKEYDTYVKNLATFNSMKYSQAIKDAINNMDWESASTYIKDLIQETNKGIVTINSEYAKSLKTAETPMSILISNMKSQAEAITDFESDLAKLVKRKGLNKTLYEELLSGGLDNAEIVKAMANATEADFKAYQSAYLKTQNKNKEWALANAKKQLQDQVNTITRASSVFTALQQLGTFSNEALTTMWEQLGPSTLAIAWDENTNKIDASALATLSSMGKTLDSGLKAVSKATNNTVAAFADDWYTTGTNVVSGYVKGIDANISSAVSSAKKLGSATSNALKQILGIKSPSRVGMGIGKFFDEGLSIGISDNTNMIDSSISDIYNTIDKINDVDFSYIGESAVNSIADGINSNIETINLSGFKNQIYLENEFNKLFNNANDSITNPIIRPTLDLTDFNNKASEMRNVLNSIGDIKASEVNGNIASNNQGTTSNYVQNIYSPKSLSSFEIWRQSKNLFAQTINQ